MNVLSLCNGCGMLRPALDKAGIEVANYYSSEIDKYACQIANKNYPDTVQLGDANDWQAWDLPEIDLLTAGFPCQDLSCAGKQQGLNGERSGLLYEVLKIRDALKPKYFLFENVASMSQNWRDEITRLVGVNPVELNSKYWGAQNRARLFWTNIPGAKNIEMMQVRNDKKIYLKDILVYGWVDREKSHCIDASYYKGTTLEQYIKKSRRQIVFTGITQAEFDALFISPEKQLQILNSDVSSDQMQTLMRQKNGVAIVQKGRGFNQGAVFVDGKTPTLTSNSWEHNNHILSEIGIRKLHPIECERLMNLPDGYTEGVSNSQRYRMLGNGWDVHVVADLLEGIVKPVVDIQPDLFVEVA